MAGPQSVRRALEVLSCFSRGAGRWSLADLVAQTKLPKATVYRLVEALTGTSYLGFDTRSKEYFVGPASLQLSRSVLWTGGYDTLRLLARPALEKLRDASFETVTLQRRVGFQRVVVDEVVSEEPLRIVLGVGRSRPLHQGAAGHVFMSVMGQSELEALIRWAGAEGAAIDREELEASLARVRAHGLATSEGTSVPGAAAIAAPVVHAGNGQVGAVISIAGPVERWHREAMAEIGPILLREAAAVSEAWSRWQGETVQLTGDVSIEHRVDAGLATPLDDAAD